MYVCVCIVLLFVVLLLPSLFCVVVCLLFCTRFVGLSLVAHVDAVGEVVFSDRATRLQVRTSSTIEQVRRLGREIQKILNLKISEKCKTLFLNI